MGFQSAPGLEAGRLPNVLLQTTRMVVFHSAPGLEAGRLGCMHI